MSSPTKSRKWLTLPYGGRKRSSTFVGWTSYGGPGYTNLESVWSTSHTRLPGGRWSGGGPFRVERTLQWMMPALAEIHTSTKDGTFRMLGPTSSVLDLTSVPPLSESELLAMGTTAIARVSPTNPAFDLATFLGELMREGLPNLPGTSVMSQTKAAKAAGSEYLNVEFGWLPMLRGVRDFASVTERADDIVRKYQQESGKRLSRRYDWPVEYAMKFTPCGFNADNAMGIFSNGGRLQERTRKTWFEADFKYYLPVGGEVNDKFRRYASYARKLYGIDLSPEVLWNLAPWSWAVDWFSNTGDVLSNVSDIGQDGMVMHHGYIMSHWRQETTDTGTFGGDLFTKRIVEEIKVRYPATPYGFGVNFADLSPRRIAILSALGLSRW